MQTIKFVLVIFLVEISGCKSERISLSRLLLVNSYRKTDNYQWLAFLKHRQNGSQFCFGSLIADKYVLTAAHCLYGKSANDISVMFQNNEEFPISQLFIHENFTTRWAYNDIGLIELSSSLFLRTLEVDFSNRSAEERNLSVIVTDGGTSKKEAPIQLKVLSSQDPLCSAYSNGLNYSTSLYCAYGTPNVCLGDSGSPLFGVDPLTKRTYIYGLVSVVLTALDPSDHVIKCFAKAPSYFTRVNLFLDWLTERMEAKRMPKQRSSIFYKNFKNDND